MRIPAFVLAAVALVPSAAQARRPQPAPAPVEIQDVSLVQATTPVETVVTAADYAARATRNGLDVRYGPADSMVRSGDGVISTWRANGEGRDGSMRRAGIGRITVVQNATAVRITLTPIAAPIVMASAN